MNSESWAKEPTRFYKDPVTGQTCKNAGVLASGILIFDSAGNLIDQTAVDLCALENLSKLLNESNICSTIKAGNLCAARDCGISS